MGEEGALAALEGEDLRGGLGGAGGWVWDIGSVRAGGSLERFCWR